MSLKINNKPDGLHIVFMTILLVVLLYHYLVTISFEYPKTGKFPKIIISVTIFVVLLDLIYRTTPHIVDDKIEGVLYKLGITGNTTSRDSGETKEDGKTDHEFQPYAIFTQFGWLFGFILGINWVGFFTTSLLFTFFYIIVNSEEDIRSRLVDGVIWSISLNVFIWVLFVYFLRTSSVFRLGFLP